MLMSEVRTSRMGRCASAAVAQLWKVLREKGWSQGDLAEQLGTSSSVVNRWLHGDRRPGRRFASELETLTGISSELWDEPPSRRFDLKPTGTG